MAFSKVGPHYDNGDEVLVYIRRLNGDTPPPGNWSSFDYYVMAALPTNDNPRYSVYNVADDFTYNATDGYYQNQDILTERYYKYKFGPSDIKYQTGTYPPAYGNMNNTLANNDLNPDLFLRAEFPPTGDGRIVYRSLLEEVRNPNDEVIRYESGTFPYNAVYTDLKVMREKSSLALTLTEFDATGGYLSTGPQYKFTLHVNFWNTEGEAGTQIPTIPEPPNGAMKVTLLDKPYLVPVIAQIKLMPSGSKDKAIGKYTTFYHYFKMDTGNIGYDYIPYRRYQVPNLETPSQLRTPPSVNPAMDFISYTGLPVVSFKYNTTNNPVAMNEVEFNKLPNIAFYTPVESGWIMPQIVDQVGQIKLQDRKGKVTYTDYTMAYPPTYRYITFESLEFDGWESRWTFKGDSKDNDPIYITSGVTEYLNGSQIWDNEFVKRRNAGPQNRGLPLHEINSTTNPQKSPRMHFQGVDCKATHMAYKIGGVGTRATIEHVNYAGTDNQNEIIYANNPAVLLFNNSSSFYKRLPECWPWSCRRWTVESFVSGELVTGATGPTGSTGATGASGATGTMKYTLITNYYSQNQSGTKIKVGYGNVPKIEISFSSFTGKSQKKTMPVLNGNPFPTLDYTALGNEKSNSPPIINYGNEINYLNGYYYDKLEISKVDKKTKEESEISDSQKLACGCKLDDKKVEFATEIFPLLHNSECKLIMKMGYLCYPNGTGCTVPNIGTAVKKIIYPFNACKFNDSLTLPLPKLDFPEVDVDWNSITVMETEMVEVCYAVVDDYRKVGSDADPNKSNVALMLHGDYLVDSSDNKLEIKSNGSVSLNSTVKKSGNSSIYMDGGNGHLQVASSNNDLDLSSYNFTFEFWALPKSTGNDKNLVFSYGGFSFECYYTNSLWTITMSNNGMSNQVTMTCPVNIDLWQNLAITRKGNAVSLYQNGKLQATDTITKSLSTFYKTLTIGSPDTHTNPKIYIDEFRITKNIDRYNGKDYIPQNTPFPNQDVSSIDPCTFWDATTVSVADQDQFLKFPDATGYIMMIAKRPCFYTSDIQVYETKDNDINFVTTIPFNEVHDCETEFLGKVSIVGNGTDFPEPTGKIVTGGDYYIKDSGHIYFNRCDRPYFSEIYKTQSLGNIKEFIDFQSRCCDYCADENGALISPANGSLGNCSALDIEGTPNSIPHSIMAGGCLYADRKLCINKFLWGKAKLKCYANMIGDLPIDPVELPCSGYIPLAEGFVAIRPIVTTHPQSAIVHIRQTATFTAAATGFPTPTIQWQISIDNGSIWVDIEGATSNSYSIVTSSLELDNGKQFRAIFKNVANTATTNVAILTVFN
jgi:hypothetical protein